MANLTHLFQIQCQFGRDPGGMHSKGSHIADNGPFDATGTATFVGHKFYFSSQKDINDIKIRFKI